MHSAAHQLLECTSTFKAKHISGVVSTGLKEHEAEAAEGEAAAGVDATLCQACPSSPPPRQCASANTHPRSSSDSLWLQKSTCRGRK